MAEDTGLVMLDAMFTIFALAGEPGVKKQQIICEIYRHFGRIPDEISNEVIWKAINTARMRCAGMRNDPAFWQIANMMMLEEITNRFNLEPRALAINRSILSDVERYTVSRRMKGLLGWLKANRFRVVIGSNQWTKNVERLVAHHGIGQFIDAIYTSESLGVRKPSPEFWIRILNAERWPDDSTACHIGNSVRSDAFSFQAHVPCLLWDVENEAMRILSSSQGGLSPEERTRLQQAIETGLVTVVRDYASIRRLLVPVRPSA